MAYDNALADAPAAACAAPIRDETFFLGRQPIVGRHRELVAYELLFRSSHVNRATIVDDVAATAAVIQHAFSDLGMAAALGGKRGYINVSTGLLLSDVIEVLPPEHVTLELLETVEITPEIVARCRQLTEAGYTLALDDVVAMPTFAMALLRGEGRSARDAAGRHTSPGRRSAPLRRQGARGEDRHAGAI
jgi:hypothetical protein